MDRTQELANRLADLEEQARYSRLSVYSRLYTSIVPLLAMLTFAPYLDGSPDHTVPNAWQSMLESQGLGAALVLMILIVLASTVTAAALPWRIGALVSVLLSAVLCVMLFGVWLGTEQSHQADHLSWSGGATFFLLVMLGFLALSNMAHVVVLNNRRRPAPARPNHPIHR